MQEMLDTFDKQGNKLKPQTREFCHGENPNCYHKAVWIWIINENGELLVQKRSSLKKNFPNKWDMPSAGHVDAGETLLQACVRETKEELGIDTKPQDYIFLKEILAEQAWEFGEVFLLKTTAKITDFVLQEEEVLEVKYLPYKDFAKLLFSNEFVPYDDAYKHWVKEELKEFVSNKGV